MPDGTPSRRGGTIAAELREWRAALGLSQPQAAAALRVPTRTLQGWEGGKPCILAETVLTLMDALRQQRAPR